jgi:arylformamidase
MATAFGGMDADELERQYNVSMWPGVSVPDTVARWNELSDAFDAGVARVEDIAYGESDRERLDLFGIGGTNTPTLIFIHGGYWRSPRFHKQNHRFCVEPLVKAGALVTMVEYDLCPTVTLDSMVEQVRKACAWVYRNIASHGGDPNCIHVAGHSAGGHLATMIATTDWASFGTDLPQNLIKSSLSMGSLHDLEPVLFASVNETLQLDEASAKRNSTRFLTPSWPMPVSVLVGGGEVDEFRRQSRAFADTWRSLTDPIEYIETAGHDHFTIVEEMIEPRSVITSIILRNLGL